MAATLSNAPLLAQSGDVVARLRLDAPEQQEFLLHGTIPVPRGTLLRPGEGSPVSILSASGEPLPTQAEIVSRYANDDDGADVIELIAWVDRPSGVPTGRPIHYDVVTVPQPMNKPLLHPAVEQLLSTHGALELVTHDYFRHEYRVDLYEKMGKKGLRRDGPMVREFVRHAPMLPVQAVGGPEGTLPHMMGVHAYVRTLTEAGFLLVDLHVHNGFDGLDKGTSKDDALLEIYFRSLGLDLPPGWKVLHAFDHPALGPPESAGAFERHVLLRPEEEGELYLMPRQAHFVRRLAIALPGWETRARAALSEEHLGFAAPGRNDAGDPLWSWWNPATARYFPQRHRLPNLDHIGIEKMKSQLASELASREEQIRQGKLGPYPLITPRLGWAHPWGVPYGGMTGGDEIDMYAGLRVVATASHEGYRATQLRMRCYVDRQPTALYSLAGRPTHIEDVLLEGAGGPYVTALFFLQPSSGDPFGFDDAPTFQTEWVQRTEAAPRWEWNIDRYAPIDFQHYVRYTSALKVLTWLGNDSLARAELEAAAEVYHLAFHEFPYDQWGYVQGGGLLYNINLSREDPNEGLAIGRGDAWGLDAVAAAYSTADDEYRERTYPWVGLIVDTLEDGQSSCTGNVQSQYVGKLLGGRFRVRRANESAYLENAFRGLMLSLYWGRDPERTEQLGDIMVRSVRAGVTRPFWDEESKAQFTTVGVSADDWQYAEFCDNVPEAAFDGYLTNLHAWSPLAYAYELSGDPFFLERAQEMAGGGSLWEFLHEEELDWIGLKAGMLALVQSLENQ